MRTRCAMAMVATLASISLIFTANAGAFTEVGNKCTAIDTIPSTTLVQVRKRPASTLPVSVPDAGVITAWKVNLPSGTLPFTIDDKLIVFRQAGAAEFEAVAASGRVLLNDGQNVFDTRIPVHRGDRLGAYSEAGTPYCEEGAVESTDVVGVYEGESPVGSTQAFVESEGEGAQVAISAIVEPDADGDGYGDETQDGCPGNGAVHGDCPQPAPKPVVKRVTVPGPVPVPDFGLGTFPLGGGGSALMLASANLRSKVWVKGFVRVPGADRRRGGRRARRGGKILRLHGPARNVQPGRIVRLPVRYPRQLKAALHSLPHRRSLVLKLTTIARDGRGRTVRRHSNLKLSGRKRGRR